MRDELKLTEAALEKEGISFTAQGKIIIEDELL